MKTRTYLHCCIDADVAKDLEEIAVREGCSVSDLAELFLKQGVGHLLGGEARSFCEVWDTLGEDVENG